MHVFLDMQDSHLQMTLYQCVIFFSWGGRTLRNVESLMMILLLEYIAYLITHSSGEITRTR